MQYEIKLGDRTFSFTGPLKFKQLRVIEPAMDRLKKLRESGNALSESFYDEMENIILAVTTPIDNTFTKAVFEDTPLTDTDLLAAYQEIAKAMGLYKPKKEGDGATDSPNPQSPLNGEQSTES
jgi:hypothetical protein